MSEIVELYLSGFWVWLGGTIGLIIVGAITIRYMEIITKLWVGTVASIFGTSMVMGNQTINRVAQTKKKEPSDG